MSVLLSQTYTPDDPTRRFELRYAKDVNATIFEETLYLDGDAEKRTFNEFFEIAAKEYYGEVCVVANSDIAFIEGIEIFDAISKKDRLIALTRWDEPHTPSMIGHLLDGRFYSGTQDAWVFIGGQMPKLPFEVHLGVVGCDQVIVGWAVQQGCEVYDPAISIPTLHVHQNKNKYENATSMPGLYGYPELVAANLGRGRVVTHEFPVALPPGGAISVEKAETCRD